MTASPPPGPISDPLAHPWIQRFGHAGLIPFVGLTLLLWLVGPELQAWVAIAMAAYAALIASFLGGIHWGAIWSRLAQGQAVTNAQVAWGMAPSLLAWPGVPMQPHAGLAWLGLVLVVCYLVDRKVYPALGIKPWLALRFRLSAVAALSCFIGAGAI